MVYKPTHNSSLIQGRDKKLTDFSSSLFGNASFRMGIVLEAFDVEDKRNISKLGPEYTVMTVEQDKQNGQNTVTYKNVIAMDGFGGVADFFQFTQRKAKKPKEARKKGSLKNEVASIVGILCLDGNAEKAVIIGSFGNPSKLRTLEKDKEHNMEGEFNGINWKIDKDGAMTVTFRSATTDEGLPSDLEAGGSGFKIEKDGSFEINDGPLEGDLAKTYLKPKEGEEEEEPAEEEPAAEEESDTVPFEKFRIDKTAKTIDLESREDMSFKTDGNVNITTKKSMNIKTTMDLIAMAEGKAAFTVNQTFDFEVNGAVKISGQSLKIESKSIIEMKASALMKLEASAMVELKAPQVLIGPSPAEPALLGISMITLGIGNLGSPITSTAIAGFSTAVIIS